MVNYINPPDVSEGIAGPVELNWKIDEGQNFHIDSTRFYKVPEDIEEAIPNGTFVEAPDPTADPYFRVGGNDCNHILVYDVLATAGLGTAAAMLLNERVRYGSPGEFVTVLNINGSSKRMWFKLFATGSDTGALSASTPLNTALGINSSGVLQIAQAGQATRAYLKRNNIATDGWILVEMIDPPEAYPLS